MIESDPCKSIVWFLVPVFLDIQSFISMSFYSNTVLLQFINTFNCVLTHTTTRKVVLMDHSMMFRCSTI